MMRAQTLATRGAVIPLLVVAALAIIGAFLYWHSATPGFCSSCHLMETRYVGWTRSSHVQTATCLQCHSEPGALGEVKAHLGGARYVWSILTRRQWAGIVLAADFSDASCRHCHPPTRLSDTEGAHAISHADHDRMNVGCTDCHDNLAHGSLSGTAARTTIETCVDCHEISSDPVCAGCHTPADSFGRLDVK